MPKPKVSVIIPYYQKKKGLLKKAVQSALYSKGGFDLEIIVVDDGSPLSAREELKGLEGKVLLLEQQNKGPAAARNTALERATGSFIAFLDSDDCFTKEHLSRALAALEHADFYFSDFRWIDNKTSFGKLSFLSSFPQQPIPGLENVFELQNPFETVLELGPGLIGLPTVVVKRKALGKTRFDESLLLSEDLVFYIELFAKGLDCVYSGSVEVICGKGINIYQKQMGKARLNSWLMEHRLYGMRVLAKKFEGYEGARERLVRERVINFHKDLIWTVAANRDIGLLLKGLSMPRYFFSALRSIVRGKLRKGRKGVSAGLLDWPVFVVGCARSGTMSLHRAMARHPEILVAPGESPLFTWIADIVKPLEIGKERVYHHQALKMPKEILYDRLRRLGFESCFGQKPIFANEKCWCAKVFPSEKSAFAIKALFPNVKFVYVVRNGPEVVHSMTKFSGFRHRSFEENCKAWASFIEEHHYLSKLESAIIVRHENLVSNPRQELKRVFDFIGLPECEKSLQFLQSTLVHSLDQPDRENVDVKKILESREPGYKGWSMEQKQCFAKTCGKAMSLAGYKMPFKLT